MLIVSGKMDVSKYICNCNLLASFATASANISNYDISKKKTKVCQPQQQWLNRDELTIK